MNKAHAGLVGLGAGLPEVIGGTSCREAIWPISS